VTAPTVYLAHVPLSGPQPTLEIIDHDKAPPLLISYAFAKVWDKVRVQTRCREWVLDSGAFTALSSGKAIDLGAFIEYAQEMRASDARLAAVFALDVIGDPVASLRNTERMWEAGIEAIPCFHLGSDWTHLQELTRYPRIAIGGAARRSPKVKAQFAAEVFRRVWPKRIHGFGFGAQRMVLQFPWHSVDASSWTNAMRFGQWWSLAGKAGFKGYRTAQVSHASSLMHGEIEVWARLERAAQSKWRSTWAAIDER